MAPATLLANRTQAFTATRKAVRPVAQSRARLVVRASAETETDTKQEIPKLSFEPNRQAETGYVDFDTAGQSNMYPVITRAYEVGSQDDTASTGSANLLIGVGAGVLAVAVLAVGFSALSQSGGSATAVVVDAAGNYKALSEYAALFSQQLSS